MTTSSHRQLVPFLLVSSVLAASFFALPAANADDPGWDTDIATSSPAGLSGMKNTEVHVGVDPGSFWLRSVDNFSIPSCSIRATGRTDCTTSFTMISGIAYGYACAVTNVYSDGGQQAGLCKIDNGSGGAGTATATVNSPNCGSFTVLRDQFQPIDIDFTDAVGDIWTFTDFRIIGANLQHTINGDTWSVVVGKPTNDSGSILWLRRGSLRLRIYLQGAITSSSDCLGGINATNFNFDITGEGIIDSV